MRAFQIFQQAPPELAAQIIEYLRGEEKQAYNGILGSLAKERKLRPVFVQRKTAQDQVQWMHETLKLKGSDEIAEHLLQIWLLKAHTPMLVRFLDKLGIQHDGEGAVDDLPEELDEKKLKSAVNGLLKKYPQPVVWTYLNLFQLQRSGGWDGLTALLEEDERLATPVVTES